MDARRVRRWGDEGLPVGYAMALFRMTTSTSTVASPSVDKEARLQAMLDTKPKDSWKRLHGWSKGSRLLREAAKLGAEWREAENKRTE